MKDLSNVLLTLRLLKREVRDLTLKIDALLQAHRGAKVSINDQTLLDIPEHLQKTMRATLEIGRPCMASEIAEVTGRERAVESAYGNQLAWRGLMLRSKKGRCIYFEPAGSFK